MPDPAFATEDHPAIVSLYRCPTVEAILDSTTVPCSLNPAIHIPHYACFPSVGSASAC